LLGEHGIERKGATHDRRIVGGRGDKSPAKAGFD
jgi:hypothetical protein